MKKLIIALVAIGAVLVARPLVKRKAERMREHCGQMAAKCKEKMADAEAHREEAVLAEPSESATTQVGAKRSEALAAA